MRVRRAPARDDGPLANSSGPRKRKAPAHLAATGALFRWWGENSRRAGRILLDRQGEGPAFPARCRSSRASELAAIAAQVLRHAVAPRVRVSLAAVCVDVRIARGAVCLFGAAQRPRTARALLAGLRVPPTPPIGCLRSSVPLKTPEIQTSHPPATNESEARHVEEGSRRSTVTPETRFLSGPRPA
jgi:hypothetical protein